MNNLLLIINKRIHLSKTCVFGYVCVCVCVDVSTCVCKHIMCVCVLKFLKSNCCEYTEINVHEM